MKIVHLGTYREKCILFPTLLERQPYYSRLKAKDEKSHNTHIQIRSMSNHSLSESVNNSIEIRKSVITPCLRFQKKNPDISHLESSKERRTF